MRASGKGGGEKEQGRRDEFGERQILEVKQNSTHLPPTHWLYFDTVSSSTLAQFSEHPPHKGRSILSPSQTLLVQIWNQLFIKSKLAVTYLYGVI